MENVIWYEEPAELWKDALPLGNGRIGAMLYGGVCRERIDLTEITFFSGEESLMNSKPQAPQTMHLLREKLLRDDYEGTQELQEEMLGVKRNYGTNLPVGSLFLRFHNENEETINYRNELNLERAVIQTTYEIKNTRYVRSCFVSNADQVLVIRIASDKKDSINMSLVWDGIDNPNQFNILPDNSCVFQSYAYENVQSDGTVGVALEGRIKVITRNGQIFKQGSELTVKNAGEIMILLAMNTDYKNAYPKKDCVNQIENASEMDWDTLLKRHVKEYGKLFGRVDLSLGEETKKEESTLRRIENVQNGADDLELISLMYNYGRYLFISSARSNSLLPSHLQGVWNDNIACRIAWTCDMHLDINTQMNYWPGEIMNLSECGRPLFQWISEKLVPSGRITAKETYGLDGWVAHIFSNPWGYSAPGWGDCWGLHVTGGAWIATHLWEHYLYSRDMEFLSEKVFPVFEGLVEFFLEYLTEDPKSGYLLPGPSISPENFFVKEGVNYAVSMGATSDVIVIREIFSAFLKMNAILKKTDDKDTISKKERVVRALGKLPPFQIGKFGQLQEWFYDFEERDPHHRHTSHLLAVYPFHQIGADSGRDLVEAAKTSIIRRTTPSEQWEDTGWARALLLLYSARLREAEWANQHINHTIRHSISKNLFVFHPPTAGATTSVYEMDGNTGFITGITEMLIQSDEKSIRLLPAVPKSWGEGSLRGICTRCGLTVDVKWKVNDCMEAAIHAKRNEHVTVYFQAKSQELDVHEGESYRLYEEWKI